MKADIKQYPFKKSLTQEFEIVDLSELRRTSGPIISVPHRAEFYHIIWFQSGTPTHLVDFNPVAIKPDSILFLNKNVVHCFDPDASFSGKAILFTDRFYYQSDADFKYLRNSILFNDLFSISLVEASGSTQLLADLLTLLHIEYETVRDSFQAPILKNYLHNFLMLTERQRRKQNFTEIKPSPDLDYVLLFRDLLDEQFREQKQVGYYTRQLSVAEKRLNTATKHVLGKTAKELINDRVLLEAKRLLVNSFMSIKEIAYELGFDEPGNFIKYFRKYTSLTPTEFKENVL
ncbi:AraC family transcriptional regulator [Spirosoma fluviale]|uniref:AraC-type DNA-binding protein n=1 Tax=Spirosoma fluviale TaxID=1597977 RepID=A0A286G6C4_9BACT|nr:helix-turn-helix transcriptional regulator [Spirosoma fluviale]SOD90669.1 AraC-type DNA-binding protein [Spirosoma fluviale]